MSKLLECNISGVRRVVDEGEHVMIELDSGSVHRLLKHPGYSLERTVWLVKSIEAHNASVQQDEAKM